MTDLEKEILEQYQAAEEADTERAMNNYREEWRKRSEDLSELVKSDVTAVRVAVAEVGQPAGLEILAHDPEVDVRRAVACWNYTITLDILVHDVAPEVRAAVAMSGQEKYLNILIYDNEPRVRGAVAWNGRNIDLDVLENDPDWEVRMMATISRSMKK